MSVRLETQDWIDPQDGEPVEHYSARIADRVPPRQPGEKLFLGGLSFGGMVALEAARTLKPDGVFVMSSGFSYRVIAVHVRAVLAAAGWMSPEALRDALGLMGLFIRWTGRPNRQQVRFLLGLVPSVNPRVCTWGGPAILRWEFHGRISCPIYRIHGQIDRIVPLENVLEDLNQPGGQALHIIAGAGHALNVTHSRELNQFLAATMNKDTPSLTSREPHSAEC